MRIGRPIPELGVTQGERESLQNWARRPKSAQALALRAKIILACAEGKTNTEVANQFRVTKQMVGKWRARFSDRRLDGLLDEPRPGTPRKVSDADVERVLTLTLESLPPNATHWSTRSLAQKCGLSRSTVSRIWRAFALQPQASADSIDGLQPGADDPDKIRNGQAEKPRNGLRSASGPPDRVCDALCGMDGGQR
jgi:hypothetical protein